MAAAFTLAQYALVWKKCLVFLAATLAVQFVLAAEPAGSFTIPAWAYDRGNARTFTGQWADAEPMVAFGGASPIIVEYDIPFPVGATYTISIRYAAHDPRPVEISLDEDKLGQACRTATGSWNTSGARWEETVRLWINPGKHTLRLRRADAFPHVIAIRFDSSAPFPSGWTLERPTARTLDSPPPAVPGVGYDVATVDTKALRRAIEDLWATFGDRYPDAATYLRRLDELEQLRSAATAKPAESAAIEDQLQSLRREALLANPLLDFDRLLIVRRGNRSPSLGLPRNWQSNSCLPRVGFDDEIAVLSPVRPEGQLTTLYRPAGDCFVGDVDLNFAADRLLFSSIGTNNRWQIFELAMDGNGLRQLTGDQPDVDSYDACYLPGGKIAFTSTACFVGVPCVYGSSHVANLYVMDGDGKNIRQLCFDQEHDWCPTVLNNGRVLYLRWEYSDTPHSNTRLLFHMNPDGTGQMERSFRTTAVDYLGISWGGSRRDGGRRCV